MRDALAPGSNTEVTGAMPGTDAGIGAGAGGTGLGTGAGAVMPSATIRT